MDRKDALMEFGATLERVRIVDVITNTSTVTITCIFENLEIVFIEDDNGIVRYITQGAEYMPPQLVRNIGRMRTENFLASLDMLIDDPSPSSGTTASRRSSRSTSPSEHVRDDV